MQPPIFRNVGYTPHVNKIFSRISLCIDINYKDGIAQTARSSCISQVSRSPSPFLSIFLIRSVMHTDLETYWGYLRDSRAMSLSLIVSAPSLDTCDHAHLPKSYSSLLFNNGYEIGADLALWRFLRDMRGQRISLVWIHILQPMDKIVWLYTNRHILLICCRKHLGSLRKVDPERVSCFVHMSSLTFLQILMCIIKITFF